MNNFCNLIYLILFLTLNFSCAKKKSPQKEISKFEIVNTSKTDTLKFIYGIRSIFQDSEGNYWLGGYREGVALFDGISFEYFTAYEGLSGNTILSIQEDRNGIIWFGTGNGGVSSYNDGIITIHDQITDDYSQSEWKNEDNNLWFSAGMSSGVYRNDSLLLNYLSFPVPTTADLNNYGVTDISIGQDGKVWIAASAALFSFDGKTLNVFDRNKLALQAGELLHIRSVFADSQGRIWVGNNGIGVLLIQENSTINFSDKNGLIHTNSGGNRNGGVTSPAGTLEHVFAIEEDSEGNIWFGDRDTGPWKYDGKTMTNYTIDNKLLTPMILSIYNDNNNNLLFGMADGGVYKFNGKSFEKYF